MFGSWLYAAVAIDAGCHIGTVLCCGNVCVTILKASSKSLTATSHSFGWEPNARVGFGLDGGPPPLRDDDANLFGFSALFPADSARVRSLGQPAPTWHLRMQCGMGTGEPFHFTDWLTPQI